MASPSLVSQTFSQSAGVTDLTFTPTLSAHTTGDMLELDVGLDGNPTVSFATGGQNGWTLNWQLQNTQGSTTPTHAKLTKRATSASETPPDLEATVGEAWGASCRVYRGAGGTLNYYTPTPVDGTDSGSSANGQGSAVSPGVGSQDFTFTSCIVQDGVQGATAGPSGYGNFQTNANATAARVEVSTSEKAATASSDTPGAWTSAAEQWIVGGGAVWEDAGGATNYTLTCDVGAYTLTGVAAALRRGYSMAAATGAYSLTGQAATISRGYRVACDVGAYTLAGHDATLTYVPGTANYTLTCETGAYALTGFDAITSLGRRLVAEVGAYSLTGIAATTSRGYSVAADAGAYSLTGNDATLTATASVAYSLVCEAGGYSLNGRNASLLFSGVVAPRRHAGTRKNYIIKGQKYALTDWELRLVIQQMLDEVKRPEVQVVTAKEVKQVSRRVWKRLKESLSSLEALTLEKVETVVESNVIEYDDEDDEELLMLL